MSEKDYHSYLENKRASLVRENRDALGLQGYTQLHKIPSAINLMVRVFRSTRAPYDGIEELAFESSETLAQNLSRPKGKKAAAALLNDEKQFVDLQASSLWFVKEHAIVKGVSRAQGQEFKLITWVGHGLPTLSAEALQTRYLNDLAPMIRRDGALVGIQDYVQMHTIPEPLTDRFRKDRTTVPPYVLHARLVWDFSKLLSPFSMIKRNWALQKILDEERGFIDFTRSAIWRAREKVIF